MSLLSLVVAVRIVAVVRLMPYGITRSPPLCSAGWLCHVFMMSAGCC